MSREENKLGDQPASTSEASGFTKIFGKAPQEKDQTAQPFAPAVQSSSASTSSDQGTTALFASTKTDNGKGTASSLPPNLSEASTQIFAAVPPPEKSRTVFATEETRTFSAATAPQSVPKEVSSTVLSPPSRTASEFTSVFQPIAPPPAMLAPPVAAVVEPAPGEFTQFFSAVSVRANAAAPAAPARSVPISAPSVQAVATSSAAETHAGDFTQLFQQQPVPKPYNAAALPAQPTMPAGVQEQAQPGSFTQMFSHPPAATSFSVSQVPPAQTAGPPPPIFGEAAPRGSFTDIFAANPSPPAAPARASAEVATFLAGEPSPVFSPPVAAKSVGDQSSFGILQPAEHAPRQTAAPGEFTRLMQSLERPASVPPASAQLLPVDAAFFASKPASAGESEYTRVLRGSAGGSPVAAPMTTPAAGSAAAPGLALAPALAPAEGAQKQDLEKPKPRLLVILLVVMNVLLLVALLVIGLVLLRRR